MIGNLFLSLGLLLAGFTLGYFLLKKQLLKVIASENIIQKIRDEINTVMVEINQTTEQNINLIEDKILQLKKIGESVDKKILMLRREEERHYLGKEVYSKIINKTFTSERPQVEEPSVTQETMQEKVLRFYRAGLSSELIATRLGTTVGEVDLIISYHRNK